jgi:hypothetical protein
MDSNIAQNPSVIMKTNKTGPFWFFSLSKPVGYISKKNQKRKKLSDKLKTDR